MVRAHFCRDIIISFFFYELHHLGITISGTMAEVKMHTCFQRQNDISGRNGILHRIADSRKSQSSGILVIVHTSVPTQVNIFTVIKKRNSAFCRNFHCFFTECCIHHWFTIFGNCRDTDLYHSCDIRKLRSLLTLRGSTCLKHMNAGKLGRFIMYIIYSVRIINGRSCIWHGNYCGHASMGSCRCTAHNVFLMCLSRITKMDMKVDDSRHDQLSFCINHTVAVFLFQLLANFRDDPVFQINIACFIRICSRIHDPASSNQNPHLCSPLIFLFSISTISYTKILFL